jgi:hypothetical protein
MSAEVSSKSWRSDVEASCRPGERFVGRKPLLELLRRSFERGKVVVADTWGMPGSGKSVLLTHMTSAVTAPNDLWVCYRFGTEGCVAADGSEKTVADYAAFQAFTARIAEDVTTLLAPKDESREARLLQDFQRAYDEARLSAGEVNIKVTSIFSSFKNSNVANVDTGTLSESALAKQPSLSAALATLLRGVTQETPSTSPRRLLIGLDEFEWVPDGLLRRWVLELVRDLDNALVLVPRFPEAEAPDGPVDCPLGRLSRAEINELAIDCLPHLELSDRLLDALEDATEGLPQAVCLAIEVLQRYDVAEDAAAAAELGTLPPDLAERRARMVETIMGRDGAAAEQMLRACAVMRCFDAAMLAGVVGPEAELEVLKRYSFVEPAPDARDGFFRLHAAVRKELSHRLEQLDPAHFLELHRRAAEYCANWIAEFEEEEDVESGSQSYGSWYRYEDARWQAAKREWLFHQARAGASGPEERELGRLHLTRVFLDAFWWIGCYIELPFCRTLVFDWRTTQADRDWADALVQILDAYPHGYEKDKVPQEWRDNELPRWDAVRAALLELRDACGVGGDPAALAEPERRHVRGLIETFLAHAARYASKDASSFANALKHYDAAIQLFEADDDEWDEAWTRFERAELRVEHREVDAARADWERSADLVAELKDEELAANLHRLAADVHAGVANADAAFAAHGRAVLHAYLFQRRPHPPDEYTLSFYTEQIARALDRLLAATRGGGDVVRAAEALAAPFPGRPALDADEIAMLSATADLHGLSTRLFPDPPTADELNRRYSKVPPALAPRRGRGRPAHAGRCS